MQPFTVVTGTAAPMLAANIDTDVIMPKQFLKGINRDGLAEGLFFDLRFLPDGEINKEFVLNQPPWNDSRFLVVGPNFGCGSSREHAVWGLKQLGIRALIGSSFAGIFYDNCQRNGVLLIQLNGSEIEKLGNRVAQGKSAEITIDLNNQTIAPSHDETISFDIQPIRKESLLLGLDTISHSLQHIEKIQEFEAKHLLSNPWLKQM